jgi:hypothetical protein
MKSRKAEELGKRVRAVTTAIKKDDTPKMTR